MSFSNTILVIITALVLVICCKQNIRKRWYDANGLVQGRRNSSALALELRFSCTNPLMCNMTLLQLSEVNLCMHSANERYHYNCVSSWLGTYTEGPWIMFCVLNSKHKGQDIYGNISQIGFSNSLCWNKKLIRISLKFVPKDPFDCKLAVWLK